MMTNPDKANDVIVTIRDPEPDYFCIASDSRALGRSRNNDCLMHLYNLVATA